jgi:replicative DNA helicase
MIEELASSQPYNIDAERAVLGSILLSEHAFFRVNQIVSAADFFRVEHRILFVAMTEISRTGQQVDRLTLKTFCRRRNSNGSVDFRSSHR